MWCPIGVMHTEALHCEHGCGIGGCLRGGACDWNSGAHHSQKKERTVSSEIGESTQQHGQRASEGRG